MIQKPLDERGHAGRLQKIERSRQVQNCPLLTIEIVGPGRDARGIPIGLMHSVEIDFNPVPRPKIRFRNYFLVSPQ